MGFVKTAAVKAFLKKNKLRVSKDLLPALDEKMLSILGKASQRAERNGRTTVMAHDI